MLTVTTIVKKLGRVRWWQVGIVAMVLPMFLVVSVSSSVPPEKTRPFSPLEKLSGIGLAPQLLAQRERKTALVIGNGGYGAEGKLNNPPNDATDVSKALQRLGFEVTLLKDVGQQQMEEAIEQFNLQLRKGGVGLFYYAGHGVQVSGENYLIPIGAKINREQDVRYRTVQLSQVLGMMEDAGNRINIVILDACRNNPSIRRFTRSLSRGLAPLQSEPEGMLIAFATAPGDVAEDGDGRNSPYTASLLQYLQKPGLPLQLLFEQVGKSVRDKTRGQQKPLYISSGIDYAFKPTESIPLPTPPHPVNPTSPQPLPSSSEPPLISKTTGADYTSLRDSLMAHNWIEADQETTQAMLKAVGRTRERTLRVEDVDKFSCEDLRIINQLWLTASDGKFGFSVQSQIYRSLGGTKNYSQDIWRKLGDKVGWRSGDSWLPFVDYNFSLNAQAGHLPSFLTSLSEGGGYKRGARIGEEESSLMSLMSRCEL